MKEFFARLYECFGLVHLYSKDLDDFLKGWDYACIGYFALPWYMFIGIAMVLITILVFALQNDLVNPVRFKKREHQALCALIIAICNFTIAFSVPLVAIQRGIHCPLLKISVADCLCFALTNAFWSLVLFGMLSMIPWSRFRFIGS